MPCFFGTVESEMDKDMGVGGSVWTTFFVRDLEGVIVIYARLTLETKDCRWRAQTMLEPHEHSWRQCWKRKYKSL
jgi:hypothetical protein